MVKRPGLPRHGGCFVMLEQWLGHEKQGLGVYLSAGSGGRSSDQGGKLGVPYGEVLKENLWGKVGVEQTGW